MPDKSLAQLIEGNDHGQDTDDLTSEILDLVLSCHHDVARELLRPTLRDEVRRRRRFAAAENEAAARCASADSLAERKSLLADSIWVPGHGYVLHGQATAKQLRLRSSYLRGQAASLCVAADQLEAEANEIDSAGVACLDELLGVAV